VAAGKADVAPLHPHPALSLAGDRRSKQNRSVCAGGRCRPLPAPAKHHGKAAWVRGKITLGRQRG